MDLNELLNAALSQRASDLHLSAGSLPMVRVDGTLKPLYTENVLGHDELMAALHGMMNKEQQDHLSKNLSSDFSYNLGEQSRFRVNVFMHRLGVGAAFRAIPCLLPTLKELAAPKILADLINRERGLILVTGPTGSGKSTTLAAMLGEINANYKKHIITIEDPIEFIHKSNNCLINQREIGRDAVDFNTSLSAALREDPDIILVGEMRDLDTIRLALTAAETGHLVFATLHTSSAAKTIDRIIDVFAGEDKAMVRSMLSESLTAVIAQTLLQRSSGQGRLAAYEILVANAAVRNLIRENKIAQLYSVMQTGSQFGMQTLDMDLQNLIMRGHINQDTGAQHSQLKDAI